MKSSFLYILILVVISGLAVLYLFQYEKTVDLTKVVSRKRELLQSFSERVKKLEAEASAMSSLKYIEDKAKKRGMRY